ncbi:MAG: AbrB/MazE/SpoVT family DNA-binding domain-containing protein [Deltaproteobacteria bacterium]|nr:AbrB/MazE/SpoVT family DNA-binding domain-containing protein [Deltaproteobacteria bacterium]
MKAVLTITRRGTVTLPAELRDHLGLKAGGLLTVETTPGGIVLRSATTRPVEIYSDERIREFEESEAELAARGTDLARSGRSIPGLPRR